MKSLVLKEYGKLRYEEMPAPQVGANDVLIRVGACGICGSDIHGMDGSTGRRIPPLVMGHEAAGTISEVGAEVRDWRIGDRVTFDSTVSCGHCTYCKQGQINLCDNRMVLGVSCDEFRRHGAFADFLSVPQNILYAMPDNVSFEHAAMVEPVSIAVHAVDRIPLKLNDTVVVVGAGMIGLLIIQVLRARGCGQIIAVDLEQSKLDLALTLGADKAVFAGGDDTVQQILNLTGGHGADAALEAVGITPTIATALESLHKGGVLSLVGNLSPQVEIPLQKVVARQLTLYGSCASNGEYPACLDLIARGAVQVEPLISATAPLSEGASWFDRLYSKEPGLLKVILRPEESA
jgi:L-iditol 2-dehydrogenase